MEGVGSPTHCCSAHSAYSPTSAKIIIITCFGVHMYLLCAFIIEIEKNERGKNEVK